MAIHDGAPLDAASDPNFNGSRPFPGGSWPAQRVPPSVLIRVSQTEAKLGRALTEKEREGLIKELTKR